MRDASTCLIFSQHDLSPIKNPPPPPYPPPATKKKKKKITRCLCLPRTPGPYPGGAAKSLGARMERGGTDPGCSRAKGFFQAAALTWKSHHTWETKV